MRKALRLKMFQTTANYRKPASYQVRETYPLPPYSTIIGMVHTVGEYDTYHPMKVSVQGVIEGSVLDLETMYSFNPETTYYNADKSVRGILVEGGTNYKNTSLNRSPKLIELLYMVDLVIHIVPDDEAELEHLAEKFYKPSKFISLGRYEDLVRVDDIDIVELEDETTEAVILQNEAYVPVNYIEDDESDEIKGTIYKLPKVFDISSKDGIRKWKEFVYARHLPKGVMLDDIFENDNVMYDSELKTPVFLV